ncbi:MAG TPA: GNAT family N-acetyltransferase [Parafilimonas sp.]|nr:GNAT family N-acetyltransferase [Parafilimonas sp.]
MAVSNIIIRNATKNDITLINTLAKNIWPVTYSEILSPEQLTYMLDLIYSSAALQKQFDAGHNFLIAEEYGQPVAFADYGLLKDDIYKLHKIYVLPDQQGKGIGKLLIGHIIQKIKEQKAIALLLNVNRYNKAKSMYGRLGFTVIGEEDIDIGEGFFMNDYVMEKKLDE